MTTLKVIGVWCVGMISAALFGFVYGFLSYDFDLFFIFPLIVASFIVGTTRAVAVRLQLDDAEILLVLGLIFGIIAYISHVDGGYMAFRQSLWHTIVSQDIPEPKRLQALEAASDTILAREVGYQGFIGYAVLNLRGNIAPLPLSAPAGRGSFLLGSGVELFKLIALAGVCGFALRDLVRADIRSARLNPMPPQQPSQQRAFRIAVGVTIVLILLPLLIFVIVLYTY